MAAKKNESPPSRPPQPPKVSIEVREDYVLVTQRGRHDDIADVRRVQADVDAALAQSGLRVAVFDNRDTEAPAEHLRTMMWNWVQDTTRFDAVAVVLQSTMRGTRANMTAVSRGVRLRAFDSIDDAAAWLRSGEP